MRIEEITERGLTVPRGTKERCGWAAFLRGETQNPYSRAKDGHVDEDSWETGWNLAKLAVESGRYTPTNEDCESILTALRADEYLAYLGLMQQAAADDYSRERVIRKSADAKREIAIAVDAGAPMPTFEIFTPYAREFRSTHEARIGNGDQIE